MIRFIWRNWWRNKERFILLVVGALVISSGLTYLIGLSETNKGTIVDELQQRWSASYDIVVRPQGSRTITEEVNLLEPNYLSGLSGGISIEQYEKIKAMSDIEVAAPIAMIGYADYPVKLTEFELEKEGIYRVHQEVINGNGIKELSSSSNNYYAFGDWDILQENLSIEVRSNNYLGHKLDYLFVMRSMLLAGIDPEQEAKLVGLDKSIIIGDEPISAIRIKVAGVSDLTEESQQLLEQVAQNIENETGLLTDITLGSSPQPTLTHVPAVTNQEELGWFQQPWVKIGSSMTIFKEAKIGLLGLIVSVIAVAIVYVWASGLVSLLARRKEFALLLAVGWRPNQLSRLLFLESSILGVFVAIISWMMLGFVYVSGEATLSPIRFLLTGLFGFMVYLLGAVIPALLVRTISPYETMRTGEISNTSKRLLKTRGLSSMAFNHFIGKWKRSLLSIIAISLPTSLLGLFLYITIRLKGVMYTTWLGQYVALEVGPVHYAAMIVTLLIAILTTAEIMWQNIAERQQEIALLKAVGWKNRNVRFLILTEGMFSGLFAAIIGLTLTFGMMWGLYRQFPTEELLFILSTGIVPILIGLVGTIIPAERAVRISPNQGMGGNFSNRKAVERRMKWVLITALLLLAGGFIYTVIQVVA
ncbi:ABC transporter permease [Sporosarcina limicola]|uniref:ABC-type antimicrobial peptide transport system permease subunit n=1 Tax=Sporosarcina limicola TaxID=34101 RepID=A0A927MST9_9BACL|nr:FtsX-like permease family protein [Sporosarcina limicola]MBE1556779.1 ABC-type antimicrobial peptide transport system permease subunit [Sporosarcina limicola]